MGWFYLIFSVIFVWWLILPHRKPNRYLGTIPYTMKVMLIQSAILLITSLLLPGVPALYALPIPQMIVTFVVVLISSALATACCDSVRCDNFGWNPEHKDAEVTPTMIENSRFAAGFSIVLILAGWVFSLIAMLP